MHPEELSYPIPRPFPDNEEGEKKRCQVPPCLRGGI